MTAPESVEPTDVNAYRDTELYDAENAIVDELPVLLPLATEVGAAAPRARI
ncbi:MAG: hypothetical protein H0U86_01580 [Chloroflexi bacterium]|nr:hypothetical protein [Chloroflexota bacterium]